MKNKLDAKLLQKKRQKNVAEQNAVAKRAIADCAREFRLERHLPDVLVEFFEEHGVDTYKSILLNHDRMPCGAPTVPYRGTWLTCDERFFCYEIFLDKHDRKIVVVEQWEDITRLVELNDRKTGTGKTGGTLSIEVLRELNE